ncbi:MAG: putative peptidoglycan glycosyltransferase FtsW [bacterium]|nr:putative peptidoglycan glycosyltransferase FtsW [bacterium]
MLRRSKTSLPPPDAFLLVIAGIVILFGLVALTSASGIVAFNKFGDSFFYVRRQLLFGLFPGMILFSVGLFIPYTFWRRIAFPFFVAALVLLVLVLIPGIGASYGRARSWFSFAGFSLQPAEIAKIAVLFCLALFLERRNRFLAFAIVLGPTLFLIMLQPDVGTLALLAAVGVVVYFVSGAPWWHLLLLFLSGGGALAGLIAMAPYRLARVMTFLHPLSDPSDTGYQLMQSLVAIGSGGWFGVGLGASRQKLQYLPEVAADSIFSIISEELGFIIVAAFILALLLFSYRGFYIARRAPDQFSRLFTVGVFTWFLAQAFLNIGSMIGILPLTGLPLPFVSYGGTALTVSLFALGVVANISRYTHKNTRT